MKKRVLTVIPFEFIDSEIRQYDARAARLSHQDEGDEVSARPRRVSATRRGSQLVDQGDEEAAQDARLVQKVSARDA